MTFENIFNVVDSGDLNIYGKNNSKWVLKNPIFR